MARLLVSLGTAAVVALLLPVPAARTVEPDNNS